MMKAVKGEAPATIENLVQKTGLPFSSGVMNCPLSLKFKIYQMEAFGGTKDPGDL